LSELTSPFTVGNRDGILAIVIKIRPKWKGRIRPLSVFLFQENLKSLKTAAILLEKIPPKTEEAKQI